MPHTRLTARRIRSVAIPAADLVRTQSCLHRLEEENATLKRIVEVGISLGKGPVGALGRYALDQAVSNVMHKTGLDQVAAQ